MSEYVPAEVKKMKMSHPVASYLVNEDLCTDYIYSAEEREIERITSDLRVKLNSGSYINAANNPFNSVFIKDGDPRTEVQGVERSTITGSEPVYENSQTVVDCTPIEYFEIKTYVEDSKTWKVPEAKLANTDHIARAVIIFISNLV